MALLYIVGRRQKFAGISFGLYRLQEMEMTSSRTIYAVVITYRSLIGASEKQERRRRDSRRANQFALRFSAHSMHLWMHGTYFL